MTVQRVVDEDEVDRWFTAGVSYQWMCEEYERQYNITTGIAFWANLRRRRGFPPRAVRDDPRP